MKFNIKYNKWSNFLRFAEISSGWKPIPRFKKIREFWESRLGGFSKKEKRALRNFKKACIDHKHGKNFFREAFFEKDNPLEYLTPIKEHDRLVESYKVLKNPFEKIYKEDLPNIKKWKKALPVEKNKDEIFKTLNTLYNTNLSSEDKYVNVYIMLSGTEKMGGIATGRHNDIMVALSQYEPTQKSIQHVMCLIWHETIHIHFEDKKYRPLIREIYSDKNKEKKIHEVTVGSLFPRGALAMKFFNIHKQQKSLSILL